MKIIAHRGLWLYPEERNTLASFERALQNGFGIETDFRAHNGVLVISHDLPQETSLDAKIFFELCNQYPNTDPHAINIKSDGLQHLLRPYLQGWSPHRYFVFDMSVPDTLGYLRVQLNTFTRISEYEAYQDFDGKVRGLWLDSFFGDWYGHEVLNHYISSEKQIAIVSPELHGRDHRPLWAMIKSLYTSNIQLMLCTDLPVEAKTYFEE